MNITTALHHALDALTHLQGADLESYIEGQTHEETYEQLEEAKQTIRQLINPYERGV